MKNKVILSLSGGLDSTVLCGYFLDKKYEVIPVSFSYGSKHNKYENESAKNIAKYYGLDIIEVNLSFIKELFKSNLLLSGDNIPEGVWTDPIMSQTVVPARNIIFISILSGIAWSKNANLVSIGVHTGDHFIYEDCRPEFLYAMDTAITNGTGNRVKLEFPFLCMSKIDVLKKGIELKAPLHLTRTCYKEQKIACGKCSSCTERLDAFFKLNLKDPVIYEES